MAAGPYKNRPLFDPCTYNDGPTGETEEAYWITCENEAFAEKEHGPDGRKPPQPPPSS